MESLTVYWIIFQGLALGCAGFAKKFFRFKVKQSETRSVSHAHVKKIVFASFRLEFFASNQSEINRAYFRFVSLKKKFFSLRVRVVFALFHFCFASDAKSSEKNTFFASKRTNFASVSLHFASKQKLWQFFTSSLLHFTSKRK
jgi:hypothetical protein